MNIQYDTDRGEGSESSLIMGEPVDYEGNPITINPDAEHQMFKQKNHLSEIEEPKKQIIHKVIYGDTLEGLSLTYDVSIGQIKARNNIESDSIYYLKEIVIPNPRYQKNYTEEEQEFMKIEEFLCHMSYNERSNKTAKFYLSENNWNVEEAVKNYREDLEWEKKNSITTFPLNGATHMELMRKMKRE